MSNQIFQSKKVLIVPGSDVSFSEYISLTSIIDVLISTSISIDIIGSPIQFDKFNEKVSLPKVNFIEKLISPKVVISFDKGETHIKNVQWNQTDKQLSFHISAENGHFEPKNLQVVSEGAEYDSVLFFKASNVEHITEIFSSFPNLLKKTYNLSICNKITLPGDPEITNLTSDNETTAETAYKLVNDKSVTSEVYTKLLASLLVETSRFTKNTGLSTFKLATELIQGGADIDGANSISEPNPVLNQSTEEGNKSKTTTDNEQPGN